MPQRARSTPVSKSFPTAKAANACEKVWRSFPPNGYRYWVERMLPRKGQWGMKGRVGYAVHSTIYPTRYPPWTAQRGPDVRGRSLFQRLEHWVIGFFWKHGILTRTTLKERRAQDSDDFPGGIV